MERQRNGGMGQRAHRDQVDSRLGDAAHSIERYAPAGFEQNRMIGPSLHGLAHHEGIHVIEEDDLGSGFDRFPNLVEAFALDLDFGHVARVGSDSLNRFADRADGHDVVILDHRPVEKAHPMVVAAAAPDGVFLKSSQAGNRLSRVHDARVRSFDFLHELSRQGRDTTEVHHEVERRSFRRERTSSAQSSTKNPIPASDSIAIPESDFDIDLVGIARKGTQQVLGDTDSTDDSLGLRFDVPFDHGFGIDAAARHVAGANVFDIRILDYLPPVRRFRLKPTTHPVRLPLQPTAGAGRATASDSIAARTADPSRTFFMASQIDSASKRSIFPSGARTGT